jgi:hypothetical protein
MASRKALSSVLPGPAKSYDTTAPMIVATSALYKLAYSKNAIGAHNINKHIENDN